MPTLLPHRTNLASFLGLEPALKRLLLERGLPPNPGCPLEAPLPCSHFHKSSQLIDLDSKLESLERGSLRVTAQTNWGNHSPIDLEKRFEQLGLTQYSIKGALLDKNSTNSHTNKEIVLDELKLPLPTNNRLLETLGLAYAEGLNKVALYHHEGENVVHLYSYYLRDYCSECGFQPEALSTDITTLNLSSDPKLGEYLLGNITFQELLLQPIDNWHSRLAELPASNLDQQVVVNSASMLIDYDLGHLSLSDVINQLDNASQYKLGLIRIFSDPPTASLVTIGAGNSYLSDTQKLRLQGDCLSLIELGNTIVFHDPLSEFTDIADEIVELNLKEDKVILKNQTSLRPNSKRQFAKLDLNRETACRYVSVESLPPHELNSVNCISTKLDSELARNRFERLCEYYSNNKLARRVVSPGSPLTRFSSVGHALGLPASLADILEQFPAAQIEGVKSSELKQSILETLAGNAPAEILNLLEFRENSISTILHSRIKEAHRYLAALNEAGQMLQLCVDLQLGHLHLTDPPQRLSPAEIYRINIARTLKRPPSNKIILLQHISAELGRCDLDSLISNLKRWCKVGVTVICLDNSEVLALECVA
ncbi:MAG: hypothetical protein KDD42_01930 [Bdellovibrionales bacterium]|nr:hypothetical protein [Bdellovibrionales bacterium]